MNSTTIRDHEVEVSDDAMEARLQLRGGRREEALEVRDLVQELLTEHGICGVLEEEVAAAVSLAAAAEESEILKAVCIARGTPPIAGEDGRLEWLGEFFESHAITLPNGGVDHYHHTRCSVYAGQPLARLVAPVPGVPGLDVLGREIPATEGHPVPLILDAGADRESEGLLVATRGGQVYFDHGHLGVSPLLAVKEVDYSVGSIDFDGAVEVQGDVGARFEVRGGTSVLIMGSVENAEIESEGQVEIRGPVLGRGEARLRSGADMVLASARDCEIDCGAHLVVTRELLGCRGRVRGDLILEHGRIVGGELAVTGQVVAEQLGSREEVSTKLRLGEDFARNGSLKKLARARRRALDALGEFARGEGKFLLRRGNEAEHPERWERLRQRQQALRAVARRARRRELVLRKRLRALRRSSVLVIRRTIHPGVEVAFVGSPARHRFHEELSGPVHVALDPDGREISISPG